MISKAQLQVVVHMFVGRVHLRWDGSHWQYSHVQSGTMPIRDKTVTALMRSGLITNGFDSSNLTEAGVKKARENVAV